MKRPKLAGGLFGGLFFFGRRLLFLAFEFVGDQFEDGDFGAIADAETAGNNAGVAARAVGEFGSDLTEQFLGDMGRLKISRRLAPGLESVALAEGDDFFRDRASGLGAGERGGDAPVFEEVGDEIAQSCAAMRGVTSEFRSRFKMSHGLVPCRL